MSSNNQRCVGYKTRQPETITVFTLFLTSISAPLVSRRVAAPLWPCIAAQCKGVFPSYKYEEHRASKQTNGAIISTYDKYCSISVCAHLRACVRSIRHTTITSNKRGQDRYIPDPATRCLFLPPPKALVTLPYGRHQKQYEPQTYHPIMKQKDSYNLLTT